MADEELKQLMRANLEVSQESLKILRKINRDRILSNIFNFVKWMIIIGVSVGAYYYFQPYIEQMTSLLRQFQQLQIQGLDKLNPFQR
jgi:hypothetical protein